MPLDTLRRVLFALLLTTLSLAVVACDDDGDDSPGDADLLADTTGGDTDGDGDTDPGDTTTDDTASDVGDDTTTPQDTTDGDTALDTTDASDDTDDAALDTADADATDVVDATDTLDATDADEDLVDATDMADVPDTMLPLAGFGDISGTCDVLDTELTDTMPSFIVNTIDFGTDPWDDADLPLLTDGGQEIIADGNAGGSSLMSEVFAYEVLERCELATLLKTETEVTYTTMGKITDLLVEIDGLKIGVSVTRAIGFPRDDPWTVAQAQSLLEGKLADVLASSANVAPADAWQKQILHVIAYGPMHATSLMTAFDQIDASIKADTIVWVTIAEGDDTFLWE